MRWLLALVLMAGAARAEDAGFPIDYDALFAAHADKVQQPEPGLRHLELPGPVIVTARDNGGVPTYFATDQSGQGAVGCAMSVMIEVLVLAGHCDSVLDTGSIARLEGLIHAYGVFMAQNSFPPVPADQVLPRLQAMIRARDARLGQFACPAPDAADNQIVSMARSISSESAVRRAKRSLSKPRLPVLNPCL